MKDTEDVYIGCDPGTSATVLVRASLTGRAVQVIILDEVTLMSEEFKEAAKQLLEEAKQSLLQQDLSALEERILAHQDLPYINDISWPCKAAVEVKPKHNPHPKAKAKLPYYHQRRRF